MKNQPLIHIAQGEFAVSEEAGTSITTILGSCVAACLWDSTSRIGGMNHILMPGGGGYNVKPDSYGVNAMEILINGIIKLGGSKTRLQAKVFGGASMIERLGDVGKRNAEFVLAFLEAEGIPCRARSLGGTQARRIQFWPSSGRVRQKLLGERTVVPEVAESPRPEPAPQEIEFFS